jgi:hypothetical protein
MRLSMHQRPRSRRPTIAIQYVADATDSNVHRWSRREGVGNPLEEIGRGLRRYLGLDCAIFADSTEDTFSVSDLIALMEK